MEFVQLQINAMDWENDAIQSKENYEVSLKHGKEVIVMEPFKGGTFINMPEDARAVLKDCNDESLAWWALRFFADLDNVCKVLTGASNLEQLDENISIMEEWSPLNSLEKEKLAEAVGIVRDSKFIECTECGYCLDDCPVAIPIPRYFGLYNDVKQFGTTYFFTQSFISSPILKKMVWERLLTAQSVKPVLKTALSTWTFQHLWVMSEKCLNNKKHIHHSLFLFTDF